MVLKFCDNRPKAKGPIWEILKKKSNYWSPIKMIFRGFVAKVITNIVSKFGKNRPKGRGVNLAKIEEKVYLRKNGRPLQFGDNRPR